MSGLPNQGCGFCRFQVYHNLHCLNNLRRAAYQHVYGAPDQRTLRHLDHCVDLLREANQCHMDMTPMLFDIVDSKNGSSTFALKRHTHTCRKFGSLHKWATARTICGGHTGECQLTEGKMVGDNLIMHDNY
ncbi:hypothetical protein LZ30DRAFT_811494 [Colletotrichum cereale]|nr:hypothetical protein LZ30DRAFT_811494 [Colletotrichum cereale]